MVILSGAPCLHKLVVLPFVMMSNVEKLCPACCASVNVKKKLCNCGHKFLVKRKVLSNTIRTSKRIAMRSKRALEVLVNPWLDVSKTD